MKRTRDIIRDDGNKPIVVPEKPINLLVIIYGGLFS
jgi:hypothetical protein